MLTLSRAVMAGKYYRSNDPKRSSILLNFVYRANRRVVNSAARLLPDQPHFIQHLETIAEQGHLAAFVVIPAHRHFLQSQPRAVRDVKQLDVKTKPIDRGCLDERATHAHAKRLEPALRVPERQSRC